MDVFLFFGSRSGYGVFHNAKCVFNKVKCVFEIMWILSFLWFPKGKAYVGKGKYVVVMEESETIV